MSKIILITGASSGFGKAIAEKFANGGWDLILTARRKEKLEIVAHDIEKKYGVKNWVWIFPFFIFHSLHFRFQIHSIRLMTKMIEKR